MFEALVIMGYLISRLPERMIHKINKDAFLLHNAREVNHPMIKVFYGLDLGLPLLLLGVWLGLGQPTLEVAPQDRLLFLIPIYLGALLRIASFFSLGGLFSLDCVWLDGVAPVETGPYRWLKHPDFVGRTLEGAGLAACLLGPGQPMLVGFVLLISIILSKYMIKLENRCRPAADCDSVLQSAAS